MISGQALIVTAAVLGLSGGLTPGPLLTLVVSETLKYGIKAGIKVSLAPLLTDTPIILAVLWLFSRISDIDPLIGLLSLLGGVFLLFIGYESIRFHGLGIEQPHKQPKSLRKGIVVNFLNPNPYLFWISIGAPLVMKAFHVHLLMAIFFLVCFYVMLVGSKMGVAVIVGKSSAFLKSRQYVYTVRTLGVILVFFGLAFLKDGVKLLMAL